MYREDEGRGRVGVEMRMVWGRVKGRVAGGGAGEGCEGRELGADRQG